jgi:death-on-curing protein
LPNDISFLSLDEALAVHEAVIKAFGGATGVRDLGLIESALYRPRSGYYEDLSSMAAALFESLVNNHPFVDGNKRVAFFGTDVFRRMNGYCLEVEAQSAYKTLMCMFKTHTCDLEHLRDWIEESMVEQE